MAAVIVRDYIVPTDTQDNRETALIDRVLEGWGKWSQRGTVNLEPIAIGFIWRIPDMLTAHHELVLSDWKFHIVDRYVAVLPSKLKTVVFIEYVRSDDEATSELKAARAGLNRLGYRQRLHSAQWTLFTCLRVYLDAWRQKSI